MREDSERDPYGWDPPEQPATPAAAPRRTGPVTAGDPRLSDPAYASDPDVLAYLNGVYGPNGTALNKPDPASTWDPMKEAWNPLAPNPNPTQGPGNPGPTGGGGGSTFGSLTQPFAETYTPYTPQALPTVGDSFASIPGAPVLPQIPRFVAPSMAEAMNDDGYKFTLDQGNQNLTNWAASRGTLNDSSTGKAFIDYGQNAATTQYGNVWNRAAQTYDRNVQTQYMDPFQAAYQTWGTGTVAPTMAQYQMNAGNQQHLNDQGFQDNWNHWLQDWNVFRDQRDSTFNKKYTVATS